MPTRAPGVDISAERVGQFILVIRRQRVLLDEDLAALYGVETRVLLQAVKRNFERFPADFMFEPSAPEWTALRSQSVISKLVSGGRRYAPYAFTKQGVAMLSSVLSSARAIAANIEITRTFVRIRKLLEADRSLARKFNRIEQKARVARLGDRRYPVGDSATDEVTGPKRRGIGFTADLRD